MAANKMRGLVRVQSTLDQTAGGVRQVEMGRIDTGADKYLNQVSADFANVGSQIGRLADEARAKEGSLEGARAGLDPEFRPTRELTIYGKSFDKAGLDVAETRFRQALETEFDDANTKFSADPAQLDGELQKRGAGVLRNVPEELRPGLELIAASKRQAYMRDAAREQMKRAQAESEAALSSELEDRVKGLHQRAYALGLDPTADALLSAEEADFHKILGRAGPNGRTLLAPAEVEKQKRAIRTEIATARTLGAYDRLGDLKQKEAFIQSFEDDFKNSAGLAKEFDFGHFQSISAQLRNGLKAERAQAAVGLKALDDERRAVEDALERGQKVPADQLAGIRARMSAAGSATPEMLSELDKADAKFRFQDAIRMGTPEDVEAALAMKRQEVAEQGATETRQAAIAIGEKFAERMQTELKKDPVSWAARVGLMPVAPLDVSSPEGLQSSLASRLPQAEVVADHYRIKPVYLTESERLRISEEAAKGGQGMLDWVGSLTAAGRERTPAIMAEINKEAPLLAFVGGYVATAGMTPVIQDTANGIGLLKTEGFKGVSPKRADVQDAAKEVLGQTMVDNPRGFDALIDAATAAYELRAYKKKDREWDDKLFKSTLTELLGQRTIDGEVYGGIVHQSRGMFRATAPIVIPPSVKQRGFSDVMGMITDEDLSTAGIGKPVAGDGSPLSIARVRGGKLVQRGVNSYVIATGDPLTPGAEGWVYSDATRQPLILDFTALTPILSKRRPDLFLRQPDVLRD